MSQMRGWLYAEKRKQAVHPKPVQEQMMFALEKPKSTAKTMDVQLVASFSPTEAPKEPKSSQEQTIEVKPKPESDITKHPGYLPYPKPPWAR